MAPGGTEVSGSAPSGSHKLKSALKNHPQVHTDPSPELRRSRRNITPLPTHPATETGVATDGITAEHGTKGGRSIRFAATDDVQIISPRGKRKNKPASTARSKRKSSQRAPDAALLKQSKNKPASKAKSKRKGSEHTPDAPLSSTPVAASSGSPPSSSTPVEPKVTLKIPASASRANKCREILSRESVRQDQDAVTPGSG
jgi:hypothetical protein